MAHTRVVCIGTPEDLEWIFENCTSDSSSESQSEQAFGYDSMTPRKLVLGTKGFYVSQELEYPYSYLDTPVYDLSDKESDYIFSSPVFNHEEVLDLRPRKDWYCVSWDRKNQRKKTREEVINWFKRQPKTTLFCVYDVHL